MARIPTCKLALMSFTSNASIRNTSTKKKCKTVTENQQNKPCLFLCHLQNPLCCLPPKKSKGLTKLIL